MEFFNTDSEHPFSQNPKAYSKSTLLTLAKALEHHYPKLLFWACQSYREHYDPDDIEELLENLPKHILQHQSLNLQTKKFKPNFNFFKHSFEEQIRILASESFHN